MRRLPYGAIILLMLAAIFYAGMMGSLSDYPNTDAAGRGMALAFGGLFGIALWVALTGLLIRAAVIGTVTGWSMVVAVALLVLSAIAASVGADLYGARMAWALAVPALLPPLIVLYFLWPRLPVGIVALALCLAPLVVATVEALPNPERDARLAVLEKARQEKLRQEEQESLRREAEKFANLGPDSSLADYLPYLLGGDTRSQEALAGARKVKSRQADVVELLNNGRMGALVQLDRLDLQATPELCRAYGLALANAAANVTKARSDYLSVAIDLERQLPNIRWLTGAGCDLDAALTLLADHVRGVSDSERMETFANTLAGLRHIK